MSKIHLTRKHAWYAVPMGLFILGCAALAVSVQSHFASLFAYTPVLGVTTKAPPVYTGYDFNWNFFDTVVAETPRDTKTEGKIIGAVVPHHLLASHFISDVYARLAKQGNVKRVIIIGPNHFEVGDHWALSTTATWQARDNQVLADLFTIEKLTAAGVVRTAEELLIQEHSITSQMPFIAEYLPGATVVPIAISGFTSQEKIETLSQSLTEIMDEETVIIASVDFSHYLDSATAQKNDARTRSLLEEWKTSELFSLGGNSEYLDSPQSIVALMNSMAELGAEVQILQNTNSGEMLQDSTVVTTSYFEIIYTKNDNTGS